VYHYAPSTIAEIRSHSHHEYQKGHIVWTEPQRPGLEQYVYRHTSPEINLMNWWVKQFVDLQVCVKRN